MLLYANLLDNVETNVLTTLKELMRTAGLAILQIIRAANSPRIKGLNLRAETSRRNYDSRNT